jgi:hypothetical protein
MILKMTRKEIQVLLTNYVEPVLASRPQVSSLNSSFLFTLEENDFQIKRHNSWGGRGEIRERERERNGRGEKKF